jgi:RNA polymerase sigma-70 factor (ECF subfamily)
MFSILPLNQQMVNTRFMAEPQKTVSAAEMEAEWVEIQAAQRQPARFRPLYERYYEPIFRFVFRRTSDEELTADLCSQVFLKALQRLGQYQFRGVPFSAWLFRIASNEVAQHYRKHQKQRTISLEDVQISDMAEEMELDEEGWSVEEVLNHLDQLRPGDVTLIELRFFEQRPFKEIAAILDITESNAKVKTYRILERMKKQLLQSKIG